MKKQTKITPAGQKPAKKNFSRCAYAVPRLVLFLLLFIFCTVIYGDVFARTEQEMFVSSNAEQMNYLLRQPLGWLVVCGRWLLLCYKSKWVGGLVLASILTATSCQLDYIFRPRPSLHLLSMLLPIAELAWMVSEGINLFFLSEPARVMLVPVLIFIPLLAASLILRLVRRKKAETVSCPQSIDLKHAYGVWVSLLAFFALTAYALYGQQNARLTARMQLRMWQQDWEGMISDGLSARRPTRSVAAYFAVAALRQGQLLERMFDIPYNYPNFYMRRGSVRDEYALFVADCNFEAGTVGAAYHESMENHVMHGPSLLRLKRMALCALLSEEYALAEKYLFQIEQMPFESAFVEKYRAMVKNPELIKQDAELADILEYKPKESNFEQSYQTPIFLGYNIGLGEGSMKTLTTSMASCLYSKKLNALIPRLQVLQQQGVALSPLLQQAVVCFSVKHPEVLNLFKVSKFTSADMRAFIESARPYAGDKDKMREALKKQWLGSYYYYYYCENNDSIATGQATRQDGGVN